MKIAVVIPALDEEASIAVVVRGLVDASTALGFTAQIIVGDNGSSDDTAKNADAAGAVVVHAARRGYGSACLAALGALQDDVTHVVFADGDGADDPSDLGALLAPLVVDRADLVIGSRTLGLSAGIVERGALTRPQLFGNQLSSTLLAIFFGGASTDLGPFRAIRRRALDELKMDDLDFGWTVQMQARALLAGLRVVEIPVHYRRRRTGRSKVSGDLRGSFMAGSIILSTLAKERRPRRLR